MENLISFLIKANLLIIFFYLVYVLLLKKETFYTYNRFFLLFGLLLSVLFPLISIKKYVWVLAEKKLDSASYPTYSEIQTSVVSQESQINFQNVFLIIFFIGVLFLVYRFLKELNQYRKLIKTQPIIKADGFKTIETKSDLGPFSFFNTIVYNPSKFTTQELQAIIAHEKVHAKQLHTLDILFSRVFEILFWYNPFVWLYKKSIVQNLEFIADFEAVSTINNKKNYQFALLKVSTNTSFIPIYNHFYQQSLIKKRIVMLNKKPSRKSNLLKLAVVIPVLILFLYQFQVKIIAQEKPNLNQISPEKPVFKVLITKNSTDEFLKTESEKVKAQSNIDLKFSHIKRNKKSEITQIRVSLNDNKGTTSEHETESDEPIEDFVIHCEKNSENGSVNFYTKKFKDSKMVGLVESDDKDVAVEMPEMQSLPTPPMPPLPPTPPMPPLPPLMRNGSKVKMPKFNAPKPPAPPRNLSDKGVAEQYERQMKAFEDQMEAEAKRFEAEQDKMSAEHDHKMAEFDRKMEDFQQKMQDFEQRRQEFRVMKRFKQREKSENKSN
jgi:beta-lactamase regulating signal transducer with metallopeptidase domain